MGKIGFIGLGVMGEPMCRNLIAEGAWPVTAYDISPGPLARLRTLGADAAISATAIFVFR